MTGRRARGDSDVVSTAIALSMVVAIGISMMILLNSRASITRQEAIEDLNREQLMLRAVLVADYAFFPDPGSGEGAGVGVVKLRNAGDVPITVFRMIVYRNGSVVSDTGMNPPMLINLGVESEAGRTEVVRFTCGGCRAEDPILLTVHYVPTALIDPRNPASIDPLYRTMLFKVAEFKPKVPQTQANPLCAVPANWIFLEWVDPVEEVRRVGNEIQVVITNVLRFRVTEASDPNLAADIEVVVDDGVNQMTGTVRVSPPYPAQYTVELRGRTSTLRYPVTITFSSPSVAVRPDSWKILTNSTVLYPDYVRLNVDTLNDLVVGLLASAYATDDASATVRLEAYCDGEATYRVSSAETALDFEVRETNYVVIQSMGYFEPTIQMAMLRVVSIDFSDVTVIVWTTVTRYVTTTTTRTVTGYTTTTLPMTTVTTINTATAFSTTTQIISTVTTTTTLTTTTVSLNASTTTVTTRTTSTMRIPSATTTTTRTTTRTTYTTTYTSTSTTITTVRTTIYSPTITTTTTRSTTIFTTTSTVKTTYTSFTATTTTTTITVTTTVRNSAEPYSVLPLEPTHDPRILAMLLWGLGLAGIASGVLFKLNWRRYGVLLR